MNITTKLQEIIIIQKNNSDELIGTLNHPITAIDIKSIENLLEEKLPDEIKELYAFANGQNDDGNGVLFGETFCNAEKIIRQLEYSRTLIKSETKTISNLEQSDKLLKRIVDFYISKASHDAHFENQKSWWKMEFECGPGSFGGPYIYETENATGKDRKILKIDYKELNEVSKIIKELHALENLTYTWDELKFVVFSNGKYEVERNTYDFDNEISFTSTPINAIQKKYFHYKWLPVFSDHGGNYIGIDLDPDSKGTKGQVINFGRDEQDMVVLAENLDDLFNKILAELDQVENCLLNSEIHLHETLKEMAKK